MKTGLVLIVEDDTNIRELYRDAFMLTGLQVETAKDGSEGVIKALELHPDVILMDILMPPGIDGHTAVSKIREDGWGKHAKVIYLTNLGDAENVVHAVERKSDEYIIKSNTDVKDVINKTRAVMYS